MTLIAINLLILLVIDVLTESQVRELERRVDRLEAKLANRDGGAE
jgi:hypothetical protein